jgi:hypothetical protein
MRSRVPLFNLAVGDGEHRRGDGEAARLRGRQVDWYSAKADRESRFGKQAVKLF